MWKISKKPSGIEPATFRFVAQCLIQRRHRVPLCYYVAGIISLYWSDKNCVQKQWKLNANVWRRNAKFYFRRSTSDDVLQWNHQNNFFKTILWGVATIQYNTIQYNTIQYNTIQYNTIQYKFWVGRPVLLILRWANSSTPSEATQSIMISATNPTLPVFKSNMDLHSDNPATNCLP